MDYIFNNSMIDEVKAVVMKAEDEDSMTKAAKMIAEGKLVSFPTETVYGLGANALNTEACALIFTTKGKLICLFTLIRSTFDRSFDSTYSYNRVV